jgi:hypothetical protein
MNRWIRLLLTVLGILCIQLVIVFTLIVPYITRWGATDEEVSMAMPGDDLAAFISSTRGITIQAPMAEVWDWLIQLGADRGGFYSYEFIEKPLGFKIRPRNRMEPEFRDMEVGRVVKASVDESRDPNRSGWLVVAVDPGRSFVLRGWGCFLLREIGPRQTRLLVRTHGRFLPSWTNRWRYFLLVTTHYLMERRMLMGIKARAEAGPGAPLSSTGDILWFAGICLSPVIMLGLLIGDQRAKVGLLALFYSLLWTCVLFVLDPLPAYSVALSVILMVNLGWLLKTSPGSKAAQSVAL